MKEKIKIYKLPFTKTQRSEQFLANADRAHVLNSEKFTALRRELPEPVQPQEESTVHFRSPFSLV